MSTLSQLMDQARPELDPLAPHYLAGKDLVVKERYLVLLLATVLEHNSLTVSQVRLLEMLLPSVQGVQSLEFYLQEAAKLDKDALLATLMVFQKDKALASALLFDLLVLLRVAGTPSDTQTRLLSQLTLLLNITDDEARRLIYCCLRLLNGETGMDDSAYITTIYTSYHEQAKVLSLAKEGNIVLDQDGSFKRNPMTGTWFTSNLPFSQTTVGKEINKEEKDFLKKNSWTLARRFPLTVNQFSPAGTFIVRAVGAGMYKKCSFSVGLVIEVFNDGKLPFSWAKNKKEPVARVLTFPEGLDAWLPFFAQQD